ncbi:MAG: substrate-binding domain-containing protein, partial [Phycisphaerae bacterium]|nr:substrate-binding domain-containing protein [Phycisphaerae bacterium]
MGMLGCLLACGVAGSGCERGLEGSPAGDATVTVAAAADLKFALDELTRSFHHRNPSIRVTCTYGSSGTFFAQISNLAPFDVFLSADLD